MGISRATVRARRSARGLFASLAVFLAAAAPALAAIAVSPAIQGRLSVRTARLSLQRRSGQIDAFAKVLDPGPLAQLQSDIETAQAAANASSAEARRSRSLAGSGGSVAQKDAEAAQAQAASDAAHLALLRQRIGLEWGPGIARMSVERRRALIAALSRGQASLVHVDTPSNEGQAGARSVDIDVGSTSLHGIVLGAARTAEPRLQSSGIIAEVTGPSAVLLSIGLIESAHINTTGVVAGVIVPRRAVVRFEGSDWVYVRTATDRFERRRLDSPAPVEAGLFVTQGVRAGDEVVVQGVAELFGLEEADATRGR